MSSLKLCEDMERTLSLPSMPEGTARMMELNKNLPYKVGSVHGIGKREAQQDSFGILEALKEEGCLSDGLFAVLCDGMGGLSDGERVSELTVVSMLQGFDGFKTDPDTSEMLMDILYNANDKVNSELGEEFLGKCGSTVVSVIIMNTSMYYISVGDSHIYVFRQGKLFKINKDHNYGTELDEKAQNGEISYEEASSNPQRAALTSFIGMGELSDIDRNDSPIQLEKNDRVLLMSDGVYGTITEEEIIDSMNYSVKDSCEIINRMIRDKNYVKQDNYTCILIEI